MNKQECQQIVKRMRVNWDWYIGSGLTVNDIVEEMSRTFKPVPVQVVNSVIDDAIVNNEAMPSLPQLRKRSQSIMMDKINSVDIAGGLGADGLINADANKLTPYQLKVREHLIRQPNINIETAKAWALGSVLQLNGTAETYQQLLKLERAGIGVPALAVSTH